MIEATQKKLREARFFLSYLETENRRAVRNEPEAFDYFMSAFVSAARSVTFCSPGGRESEVRPVVRWLARRSPRRRSEVAHINGISTERRAEARGRGSPG